METLKFCVIVPRANIGCELLIKQRCVTGILLFDLTLRIMLYAASNTLQDDLSRAETLLLCNTDNQYIVPTSGNPLRGLIQDHVASGVKLTCKETFLTKAEFQQLLYTAVSGLPGNEIVPPAESMIVPQPAILKPRAMWTGKQVVSSLLRHLCRPPLPPLNLDGKTRTPAAAFGADEVSFCVLRFKLFSKIY